MRHLARKYKLEGDTDQEKAYVDMIVDQLSDFRSVIGTSFRSSWILFSHRAALVGMCYNANFNQEMLKDFVEGKLHSISFGEPLQHRLNTLEK